MIGSNLTKYPIFPISLKFISLKFHVHFINFFEGIIFIFGSRLNEFFKVYFPNWLLKFEIKLIYFKFESLRFYLFIYYYVYG